MNNAVDLLATASRFAIAAAIIYFAYQLAQINDNVAVVTQSVEQVSQYIEPTLEEVKAIRLEITQLRNLVPDVLAEVAEVRKQIPIVVAEVAEVRQQIPPILAQVESIKKEIDPILQRVDKTVAVVDDTQRQIPQIINTADNAIAAINDTNKEIKLTRESIDPTLDRVDGLVEDAYFKAQDAINAAEDAGKKASEGAVSGFFTGLIKLPFKFIGSFDNIVFENIHLDGNQNAKHLIDTSSCHVDANMHFNRSWIRAKWQGGLFDLEYYLGNLYLKNCLINPGDQAGAGGTW